MISKIKKPVSILLVFMMIVSLFAVVPISAGAQTHDSGIVWYPNLQVGDIITADVTSLEQRSASPTIVIKGGTYADNMDEIVTNDLTGSESPITFTFENGKIIINDMNTWKMYHFVDQNGNETNQMIVLAIEGVPDTEGWTITFGGFDPDAASAATTVDLSTLDTDYEAQDGDTLTGTLAGQYKITVADGATVTLKDATITCLSASTTYDGIALLGDATILLEGENTVKGGHKYNAGIFVPEEKTLTIDGTGSLNVSSGGSVSAIGAKRSGSVTGIPGGNIVINGGTINATGGNGGAGIGGCTVTNCGTITINGGNITAVGNDSAPGIGSGNRASFCAGITISGGTVTATGNGRAAGIGCGYSGSCGNITIVDTVTKVTAIKGDSSPNSIGPGSGGYSCGTITIGGEVTGDIAESPYVYPTYTVTWKNGDTVLETDTDVVNGSIPTYDGETPTKAADGDLMYVFSGWTDGTNTYGASDTFPAVTGDVTYTATFTSAVISERAADLVEITDHETVMDDLGFNYEMFEWGRSMTAQEAITLAQYMSAQNDDANCAVLYEVVDDYELQYAMSDGTTGSRTSFIGYALNDFLPGYKVYYLPLNLNPQTIELTLNPDNASVIWYDATDSDGYWSMEAAYNDGCYLVLKGNSNQPAGTYAWADMGSGCGIRDYDASQEIYFVDGSCSVTVNEDVVTVSGTFTGRDRNTYVVTVTYEAPYYTITDESVNGAVTAGVNGADVTKAKAGKTVLLNVAPADGYRLKSITASAQKTTPEDFSDLVALMGDAVFDGDENYECGGYTCKVENGKFVVYNGTTLVTELSESNMTGFNGDSDYVEANSEDALWAFYVKNGEITGIDVSDTNDDYIFCSLSGSKSTGTLQPVQVDLTTVAEGSQYSFTMPAKNVTVKAEFEAIPTYTVTWKNGNEVLETDTDVAEGTTPEYNGATPTKAEDEQYTYTFAGWSPEITAVTADVTYTATFESVKRSYTITWKNEDGSVIDTTTVEYGETPTHAAPEKAATAQYNYTFLGWTPAVTAVTGNAEYTATFDSTKRSYTITWKNDDGSVIDTTTVEYGETPTHADPEKAEDEQYTYTFAGWTPEIAAVTGDAEYTATYTATDNHLNGPQDDGYFYLDDVKQLKYQLIKWNGDYYFINDYDKYAKNNRLYLGQSFVAGSDIAPGYYVFGADGKMVVKNGPNADGYFYINNAVCRTLYRFVEFEGDWYFIYDGYKYAKNAHLYLSGSFLEGTDFAPGYFDFDADGKYYIPEELPEGANADGYFYINGVKQTRYQLIKYGNDFYFINDDDKYAKNTKLYLSNTYVSGTDLPAGLYEFGADGKMIISALKNGPQDDGYFYINGARQNAYQLVNYEGDYYFINDGHKIAKNARLYLGSTFLKGTDFAPGYYVFGADGKMVIAAKQFRTNSFNRE